MLLNRARIAACLLASLSILFAAQSDAPKKPRLVLAIVIDQFRYDYLLRFQTNYKVGLADLLSRGAVFTNAYYPHAATVTAVGHSTFLTGATPSVSGIIANDWYDRELGKTVSSVIDFSTKLVGGPPGATGSSPHQLLVSTVADELKMQGGESKVIGISIKDRSAILPGGRMADAAYWYDPDSVHWVTSTWYRPDLPDWVKTVNGEKWYQRYVGAQWRPVDSTDDSAPAFCTMVAGGETRYCNGLEATPWGNEMIEEFAERALDGENLGRHGDTDILAVSFSSNDYVGHAVGPDDPAVRDMSIRTDRLLGKLFAYATARVGAGNFTVVLTADHGVAPVPEVNTARKMPGGRLSDGLLSRQITNALVKRFGAGQWLLPGPTTMAYLNLEQVHKLKLDVAEVERVAAEAARSFDHIHQVYTASALASGQVQQDPISLAFSLGFFGPRSGNLFILPDPYYLFDATGTSHGTPYDYDRHVPVIFFGAGIKPGMYTQNIAPNDIAPTLAAILRVEQPSGSMGRVLSEMFQ